MNQIGMIKPSYERIKFLQNQLRTAIQNHHVLLLKSRLNPSDTDIKNQMHIHQSLIISMGRTQNELLYQLNEELERGIINAEDVEKHLSRPIPKNIPQFAGNSFLERPSDNKISPLKDTDSSIVKCYGKKHSLLKSNNKQEVILPKTLPKGEEIIPKSGLKKSEDITVWKSTKKLQSVLKPKVVGENGGFIKVELDCKGVKRVHAGEDTTPPKRRKTTDEEVRSGSRSNSVSPKPAPPRKYFESKTFTRSKKKLAAAAAAAAAIAASRKSDVDLNTMEELLKNEPIDPNIPTDDKILDNLDTYMEMGQSKFLEHFSLISLSERDALTIKKCGRKRRTVAGQSSLYNDYFQPSALSMKNPKWRYEMQPVRRTSRESSVGSKKTALITPTEEAVAEASEMAAMEAAEIPSDEVSHLDGNQHEAAPNAVVVETAAEPEDEDDKKFKLCLVCRTIGDVSLEICQWCSERYHTSCLPAEDRDKAKDTCPNCLAQISSIKSIVGDAIVGEGAGGGVSSASSLELIKRYLPT